MLEALSDFIRELFKSRDDVPVSSHVCISFEFVGCEVNERSDGNGERRVFDTSLLVGPLL